MRVATAIAPGDMLCAMNLLLARATRSIYRREQLPHRALWWLAAAGVRDWIRMVVGGLKPHLGEDARGRVIASARRMFERRYAQLRLADRSLPSATDDTRAVALTMAALYRIHTSRRAAWVLDGLGGAPRDAREWLRAARMVRGLSAKARWEEVTVHLGELLIVLTEDLADVPRARKLLGDLCFAAGARYGQHARKAFHLDADPRLERDPAALAIEVLRMTEYVFRVNPEHWGGTDATARSGWLEGSACPWFPRPGWEAGHCGIFGQFQSGICSAFGLRYTLAQTIPKHGGNSCRVDLKPIAIRRGRDGAALDA